MAAPGRWLRRLAVKAAICLWGGGWREAGRWLSWLLGQPPPVGGRRGAAPAMPAASSQNSDCCAMGECVLMVSEINHTTAVAQTLLAVVAIRYRLRAACQRTCTRPKRGPAAAPGPSALPSPAAAPGPDATPWGCADEAVCRQAKHMPSPNHHPSCSPPCIPATSVCAGQAVCRGGGAHADGFCGVDSNDAGAQALGQAAAELDLPGGAAAGREWQVGRGVQQGRHGQTGSTRAVGWEGGSANHTCPGRHCALPGPNPQPYRRCRSRCTA